MSIFTNYDLINIVKNIQTRFAKSVDFRFWRPGLDKVEWDDLLEIVKSTTGVKYVPDTEFSPNADIIIDKDKLPRFRGFRVNDLAGNVLLDQSGVIDPIYYPNNVDPELESVLL